MVILPDAPIGDRRRQLKSLRGTSWRNSWRNSSRTLDSRDGLKQNDSAVHKKVVRFPSDESSLVSGMTPTDNTPTDEDIPAMWYQIEDYIKFEKDCALTSYSYLASRRGRGCAFDAEKYSVRGLESHTDERFGKASTCEKEALSKALKAEEGRQKAENIFPDVVKIRKVSLRHTKGSRNRALALAQLDAKEARENKP